jgi:hypothetical protein
MTITLTWLDGSSTTAIDWVELEEAVRAAQWVEYPTRRDFRVDVRHRCKVWTGVRPNLSHASSESFLRAVEASGLCRLDVDDDDHDQPVDDQGANQ